MEREATAVCKRNEVSAGGEAAAALGGGGEVGLPGPARYLLRSRKGMVEAGHIGHYGLLVGPGRVHDVCK